jgi:fatty acid desaturase
MPLTTTSDIPRYRQELKKTLPPELFKPDNWYLLWLVPHTAVIGASLWVLAAHFTWWLAPFLSLLIGHSFACLGFLAHETCHGGSIRNKRVRHLLTGICFSPFAIGPYLWSRWHNGTHHGHTQHHELDPDRLFTIDEYKDTAVLRGIHRLPRVVRNLVIFSFFSLLMTQHNISMIVTYLRSPESTARDRATILWQFLFPKLAWITVTALLGWQVLLFGYVFPLLVANFVVISYIATNHFLNPLADESDVLATSLSVTWPKWLGWVDILHCYFGAHVAHHLFPQAPTRHARRIEREIERLWPDRFHVMPFGKALKLLWNTPWVYDQEGTAFVDPTTSQKVPSLGHGLEER